MVIVERQDRVESRTVLDQQAHERGRGLGAIQSVRVNCVLHPMCYRG